MYSLFFVEASDCGDIGISLNNSETISSILGDEVSTSVYVSVDCVCVLQGYSITQEFQGSKTPFPLIQRCNHHSNRVLQALMKGTPPTIPPMATAASSKDPHLQLLPSQYTQCNTVHSDSLLPLVHDLASWQLQQVLKHYSSAVIDVCYPMFYIGC